MEELGRRVDDLVGKMDSCKDDLHHRMTTIEKIHIEKLIKLETQMENAVSAMLKFVTQSQFEPVKFIAYGLAGGVLTTVLVALLAKVIMK